MNFLTGVAVGSFCIFILAEISDLGAQKACRDLHHVKCVLKYVPDSNDEASK